jgi:tRNA uridine 5-carboxymethylaminomethyl modification enzyme
MNIKEKKQDYLYDVIVIGAGHAGIEAAYAAARMGCKTALITLRKDRIGWMPCNPAIGGIGKGHMVFEISALGGLMPQLCTKTYLQAKMLNTSKGPAVQGLRLQIDKEQYARAAQETLSKTKNLTIIEDMVDELILDDHKNVRGLITAKGETYTTNAVILTSGTFLNGMVHIGQESRPAGRRDEQAVMKLAEFMKSLNLEMGRLKTGTPPRLIRETINFSVMEEDVSDDLDYLFEFQLPGEPTHKVEHKMSCYITHTNPKAHQIVFDYAQLSPIFSNKIQSLGPRYCPSIEMKITRFAHKSSHHIFVEPETACPDSSFANEVYPNGLSTCMPKEGQEKFIRSIKGFENAVIAQYGYAIEYDFVMPHQLHHTLELKTVPGFFLAGQINGTTGYEEAAGQGIIAGINAALKVQGRPPYIMSRNEGYIGIMIDDLVTFGVDEPYRMFTSRAERRLLLRQDNTFARLGPKAYELGLISKEMYDAIIQEVANVQTLVEKLEKTGQTKKLVQMISDGKSKEVKEIIRSAADKELNSRVLTSAYAEVLYAPYKKRELREIEKSEEYRMMEIPKTFIYKDLPGLSKELQEKLTHYKPATIAQAGLIQGMTPAAISLLIFRVREIVEK